jgi:hypothetical protein
MRIYQEGWIREILFSLNDADMAHELNTTAMAWRVLGIKEAIN